MEINAKKPAKAAQGKVFFYQKNFSMSDSAACLHLVVSSPRHLRNRGVAYIWAALVLLLIILLVGLSLDTAKVCLVINQMQNAADAAALAGALVVKADRSTARLQAQTIALKNFADGNAVDLDLNVENDPTGDIVIGWYNRGMGTFDPVVDVNDPANALAVIASRTQEHGGPISLNFGPIVNVDTIDVAGTWLMKARPYAIAMAVGGTGAGLIALADTGRGVHMQGDFTLSVMPIPPAQPGDGEVQVNSESDDAFTILGKSTQLEASAVNIWGDAYINADEFDVPYSTGVPPIPDPLASLPAPTWNVADDLTAATKLRVGDTTTDNRIYIKKSDPNGNPWEIYPGYYSGGFNINSADSPSSPSVHFNPGIYILGGSSGPKTAGLVIQAGSYVVSDEAMFHIIPDGIVDIQGNGGIRATPPTSGIFEGITIFQARDNYNVASIYGTANLDLDGTLYFPVAEKVNLRGGGWGFGNQLIGWRFDIRGQGILGIQYDGRNRAPTTSSFLIE